MPEPYYLLRWGHTAGKRVPEPQGLAREETHLAPTPPPRHLPFSEAYLGLGEHREGRAGVLKCLLGRSPQGEAAGNPQRVHPGDLTDPRALRPVGKGQKDQG